MDDTTTTIEQLVTGALAAACRLEPARVERSTSLLDLGVDSLTLMAVLSQIEALFAVELLPDDTLALLGAADVGALVAALERCIARARAVGR
jgi:acyl carrier protein